MHLVNPEVGVGRDDGSSREIDSLAREVSTEPTLLALEALAETSYGFVILWEGRTSSLTSRVLAGSAGKRS